MPWWKILCKYSIFDAGDSGWSLIIGSSYIGPFLEGVLKDSGAGGEHDGDLCAAAYIQPQYAGV
ncbi:MAG: hypothetical protein WBX11_16860 [Thiobacillaceae bacterium]